MHPYLIICELCELCEQMSCCQFFQESVYIFRKSCEQEIVRSLSRQMPYRGHRFSRYSESSESGEAANRKEMISPANEQYENRSRLLRYHYKQEPLRMQRKQRSGETEYKRQHRIQRSGKSSEAAKQRSGIQAVNAAACCLSGARASAYCLLAADSICRNLKDLLLRLRIEWARSILYIANT